MLLTNPEGLVQTVPWQGSYALFNQEWGVSLKYFSQSIFNFPQESLFESKFHAS